MHRVVAKWAARHGLAIHPQWIWASKVQSNGHERPTIGHNPIRPIHCIFSSGPTSPPAAASVSAQAVAAHIPPRERDHSPPSRPRKSRAPPNPSRASTSRFAAFSFQVIGSGVEPNSGCVYATRLLRNLSPFFWWGVNHLRCLICRCVLISRREAAAATRRNRPWRPVSFSMFEVLRRVVFVIR